MIITQPQTPRHKLSVDIPSGFPNAVSPASPTSPFSSSPVFTPTKYDSVPPSPTLSGSWNTNKTQAELTALLKDAYNVVRERERDLTLAAEIGKSLLENNIALKAKYESAIVQLQHLQREKSKAATFTIQHQVGEKHATPIAPPNNSLDVDETDYESDMDSIQEGWSSSIELPSSDSSFKRKNHQNSGLNYKDLENLRDLETLNQELQQKLDDALRECNDSDKTNKSKIRKLETEVQHFQDACALATQKFEDLQKENDELKLKQKSDFWNLKYAKKSNENDDYIETLVHKVQELEEQNSLVERAKTEIERKLVRTSKELEDIQVEYDDLIETSRNYEMLQLVNRDQEKLIEELNENLEEQRALVVSYRSGMWSQKTSRANSISDGSNIMSNALRRLSNPDSMSLFGAPPKQGGSGGQDGIGGKIKKTLLSELENEWFREIFQRDPKKKPDSQTSSPVFSPISSERDLNDYFLSNGARDDDDMDYLSDDDFSFFEFEVDQEKANRLREWFWKRWARAVYRFLRTIWRWCRFIAVIIAAVLMALYRGPDDVLPSEM